MRLTFAKRAIGDLLFFPKYVIRLMTLFNFCMINMLYQPMNFESLEIYPKLNLTEYFHPLFLFVPLLLGLYLIFSSLHFNLVLNDELGIFLAYKIITGQPIPKLGNYLYGYNIYQKIRSPFRAGIMLVLLSFSPVWDFGRCLYTCLFWFALYVEAVNDDRFYFERYDAYKEYLRLVPDRFFNLDFLFGNKKRKIENDNSKEKEKEKEETEKKEDKNEDDKKEDKKEDDKKEEDKKEENEKTAEQKKLDKKAEKERKKQEKKAKKEEHAKKKAETQQHKEKGEKKDIVVKMKTRLDNRVMDLRVPTTQAIFKVQSGVCHLFREFLDSKGFTEIHTPKLIAGASEGGANVFKMKYFGTDACLAQSPQLYKQMCIIGDMKKVYEIGAVFRAENSMTSRHLCEFTGLDFEMEIKEHYFEVLDVIGELFYHIFEGLNKNYKKEIETVNSQYPFEPLVYSKEALKLDFKEGCKLLEENGYHQSINDDLDTENEKQLGRLVKEKYNTDFYILYGYPKSARPFYTMPDPHTDFDSFTNSYDAFIRGEEVLSGAQRIHDYDLLLKKVNEKGINPSTLKDYLDSFKLGAPPHGGAGIGLERVVKLFLGIKNIKKCVMFPRDPKRLTP
jgi:aspartyl-tRNA synthetase